jgi:hypothetical protein
VGKSDLSKMEVCKYIYTTCIYREYIILLSNDLSLHVSISIISTIIDLFKLVWIICVIALLNTFWIHFKLSSLKNPMLVI